MYKNSVVYSNEDLKNIARLGKICGQAMRRIVAPRKAVVKSCKFIKLPYLNSVSRFHQFKSFSGKNIIKVGLIMKGY